MVKIQGPPSNRPMSIPQAKQAPRRTERPDQVKHEAGDNFAGRVPDDDLLLYGKHRPDAAAVARLQEESEKAYSGLRQLVEQLLTRQGMSLLDLGRGGMATVDETARAEAAALVADDGELGAEAVSTRIVDFAKALSGGDPSKIGLLRGAIQEGFREATRVLGGTLPQVSLRTYDLVMQKLDA